MNEPTRMKRYRTWDYADEDQDEENTGTPMLLLADLQAWAAEVMGIIETMPHHGRCGSQYLGGSDAMPYACSCNLGKLKAKLGEVCDGF